MAYSLYGTIVFELTRHTLTNEHNRAEIEYLVRITSDKATLKSTNTVHSVERDVTLQVPCLNFNESHTDTHKMSARVPMKQSVIMHLRPLTDKISSSR